VSWSFVPAFDAAHQAALDAGKPLVYVSPPAGWAVRPLFAQLTDPDARPAPTVLALVAESDQALDLLDTVGDLSSPRPFHAVTGLSRAARLLRRGAVRTLLATAGDALGLVSSAVLKLDGLRRVVVLWPELHEAAGTTPEVEQVLGEAAGAQRLVAVTDPGAAAGFLERYARRAAVVLAAPRPEEPGGRARYAVVDHGRLVQAARAVLDASDPPSALVWEPRLSPDRWGWLAADPTVRVASDPGEDRVALAIATDLPSGGALAALRAVADEVVVLARPWQVSYLERIAQPLAASAWGGQRDRALDWRAQLRAAVRDRLAAGAHHAGVLALGPLFDEFDPALVAAAMVEAPASPGAVALPRWVHLHLSVGRRDEVRTGDVVGALLNAAGLEKDEVGRVDVRDAFTLVEVRDAAAERARRGLQGTSLRGRTVTVRFDRR
jgi:hypothetical protein